MSVEGLINTINSGVQIHKETVQPGAQKIAEDVKQVKNLIDSSPLANAVTAFFSEAINAAKEAQGDASGVLNGVDNAREFFKTAGSDTEVHVLRDQLGGSRWASAMAGKAAEKLIGQTAALTQQPEGVRDEILAALSTRLGALSITTAETSSAAIEVLHLSYEAEDRAEVYIRSIS